MTITVKHNHLLNIESITRAALFVEQGLCFAYPYKNKREGNCMVSIAG